MKFLKLAGSVILAIVMFLLICSAIVVFAATPQETLNRYIASLQKSPNDDALRKKIIKHVQEMKPRSAIPAEAEKYEGRAEYAIKNAKNEADFLDAANEYGKALLIAPWVSSYYFNQAIAFEKANKPKEAKQSFELYLVAAPHASDARDIRKRIAGLEYALEKSAKGSSYQVSAANQQNEHWIKNLDGARFVSTPTDDGRIGYESRYRVLVYHIRGSEVLIGWIEGMRLNDDLRYAPIRYVNFNDNRPSQAIQNKQFTIPRASFEADQRPCTGTISDDGQFISSQCPSSNTPLVLSRVK